MLSDELAWLRWVLIPNLGLKRSHQLLNLIDSPQALFLTPDRWPLPESVRATLREMNLLGEQHPVHRRALEQLSWRDQHDSHHLLFPDHPDMPTTLSELYDAPLVLWVKGERSVLNQTQVGLVGSRHASPNALRHARTLSQHLSEAGLVVTSGGAKGIDTACHSAVVSRNGATIAVLGCGIDVVYPKNNRQLFEDIARDGCLVSEYPLGTTPRPGHFPRRNRLISALSAVVGVIEASPKSGSLITAMHALEQGRDVFAMPGDIGNPNSAGCHQLIQEGASLLCSADDILKHLDWRNNSAPSASSRLTIDDLTPVQHSILETLSSDQHPLDMLAYHLQVPAHQLLEPVLELELRGLIEQLPGGYTLCDIA